jgi:hypothetical protein
MIVDLFMSASKIVETKMATVYRRKRTLFAHASSLTNDGVWILTEPVLTLDESAADADIGAVVQAALEKSHINVPHPKNWSELLKPLLKEAGVKSWARFVAGSSCVVIEFGSGKLSVIPTENLGSDGGFEDRPPGGVTLNGLNASEIGSTVRELLH